MLSYPPSTPQSSRGLGISHSCPSKDRRIRAECQHQDPPSAPDDSSGMWVALEWGTAWPLTASKRLCPLPLGTHSVISSERLTGLPEHTASQRWTLGLLCACGFCPPCSLGTGCTCPLPEETFLILGDGCALNSPSCFLWRPAKSYQELCLFLFIRLTFSSSFQKMVPSQAWRSMPIIPALGSTCRGQRNRGSRSSLGIQQQSDEALSQKRSKEGLGRRTRLGGQSSSV